MIFPLNKLYRACVVVNNDQCVPFDGFDEAREFKDKMRIYIDGLGERPHHEYLEHMRDIYSVRLVYTDGYTRYVIKSLRKRISSIMAAMDDVDSKHWYALQELQVSLSYGSYVGAPSIHDFFQTMLDRFYDVVYIVPHIMEIDYEGRFLGHAPERFNIMDAMPMEDGIIYTSGTDDLRYLRDIAGKKCKAFNDHMARVEEGKHLQEAVYLPDELIRLIVEYNNGT